MTSDSNTIYNNNSINISNSLNIIDNSFEKNNKINNNNDNKNLYINKKIEKSNSTKKQINLISIKEKQISDNSFTIEKDINTISNENFTNNNIDNNKNSIIHNDKELNEIYNMKDYNSNQIYNSLFNYIDNNNNNYNSINNNSNNKNNQIKINNFLKRLDYNIKNKKEKLEKLKQKFFEEKNYNNNININYNNIYKKKRSFSQFFADQKRHADILESKLNKMRTESDNKIKNTMKDRPNINSHSKKLSQNLNNDIIERLYHNNLYKTNKKDKNINKNNNNDNYNDNLNNNNNSNKKKFNPILFENLYNDALLRKIHQQEIYDDYYLEFDYPIKTPNLSNKILYNKFRNKFQNEINNTIFNHNKNTITFKEIKFYLKI